MSFGLANSFSPGEAIAVPRLRFYAVARGQIPLPPKTPWPRLQPQDEPVTTLAQAKDAELPAPSLSSFGYGDDFAPMIPEPGSLQRQASFPPLPETNGPSRLSAAPAPATRRASARARRGVRWRPPAFCASCSRSGLRSRCDDLTGWNPRRLSCPHVSRADRIRCRVGR